MRLPAEALECLEDGCGADSWHVVKVGWGKGGINHCVTPEGGALCVRFPEGSINPRSAPRRPLGGIGFYSVPSGVLPCNAVELRYDLRFDHSFEPALGGKLPGLFMSRPGRQHFCGGTGGHKTAECSSVRLMWRKDFAAEAYVYSEAAREAPGYADIPHSVFNPTFGDSLWRGELAFRRGEWNSVRMRVVLNTPGRCDGLLEVDVNGINRRFASMAWRPSAAVQVSALLFEAFYGGSSEKYACPRSTCILFRNFEICDMS